MSNPVANKKPCRFRVQQDRLNLSFPAVQGTPQCIKSIGASVFLANYTPGVKLFRKKIPAPTEYATAGLICSRPARVGLGQQQTSISKCLGKKSRRRFACMRKKHRQSYLVSGAAKRRPCDILPEYQTCARSRARCPAPPGKTARHGGMSRLNAAGSLTARQGRDRLLFLMALTLSAFLFLRMTAKSFFSHAALLTRHGLPAYMIKISYCD